MRRTRLQTRIDLARECINAARQELDLADDTGPVRAARAQMYEALDWIRLAEEIASDSTERSDDASAVIV